MTRILLHSPLDMHLHLREGAMLQTVTPLSAQAFAGAVIMPNLVPPVDNRERLERYRASIHAASDGALFEPYMTLFFKAYDESTLHSLAKHIIGIKLYPAGVTTYSDAGVQTIKDAIPTLVLMQELAIPLLVHGETHGFVLDRERQFLAVYDCLATRFPRLTIIMEHITTREAVVFLDRYPNVYATVTLHHLLYTLDDIAGGLLQPHLFCKPLAKRPEDAMPSARGSAWRPSQTDVGSDSAPHPQSTKECSGCAAAIHGAHRSATSGRAIRAAPRSG
jgi:dihydroorotase